jgi:uridylate kinase
MTLKHLCYSRLAPQFAQKRELSWIFAPHDGQNVVSVVLGGGTTFRGGSDEITGFSLRMISQIINPIIPVINTMINHSAPLSPLFSASLYTHTARKMANMKKPTLRSIMKGTKKNGKKLG